jgi:phage terminase Nu1 subunit (DNA packaging protein)
MFKSAHDVIRVAEQARRITDWMTVRQAADLLDVSTRTVRYWAERGILQRNRQPETLMVKRKDFNG